MKRFSFFFNDTATTEIYTLSLHDALPISFGDVLTKQHHGWIAPHLLRERLTDGFTKGELPNRGSGRLRPLCGGHGVRHKYPRRPVADQETARSARTQPRHPFRRTLRSGCVPASPGPPGPLTSAIPHGAPPDHAPTSSAALPAWTGSSLAKCHRHGDRGTDRCSPAGSRDPRHDARAPLFVTQRRAPR